MSIHNRVTHLPTTSIHPSIHASRSYVNPPIHTYIHSFNHKPTPSRYNTIISIPQYPNQPNHAKHPKQPLHDKHHNPNNLQDHAKQPISPTNQRSYIGNQIPSDSQHHEPISPDSVEVGGPCAAALSPSPMLNQPPPSH